MVIRFKVLTYKEFLDLEPWEISMFADSLEDAEREEWERTRFLVYTYYQKDNKKRLKPTDIIKFNWDKENNSGGDKKTTKEQFEDFKKQWQAQVKI